MGPTLKIHLLGHAPLSIAIDLEQSGSLVSLAISSRLVGGGKMCNISQGSQKSSGV